MGVATPIKLAEDERDTLVTWVRRTTTEQRMVQRARIVLEAAAGKTTKEVAALLEVRPATVSKWRTRFARHRVAGLADAPRTGKPRVYDETTERRILAQLDQPPPDGYTTWTGELVAKALGDVPALQVWRVLQKQGISVNNQPIVQGHHQANVQGHRQTIVQGSFSPCTPLGALKPTFYISSPPPSESLASGLRRLR